MKQEFENVVISKERQLTEDQDNLMYKLLNFSQQNEYSTAIWRLPNSNTTHQIIDSDGFLGLTDINLEDLEKGFLFCPYNEGEKAFIRGDIHYSSDKNEVEFREDLNRDIIDNFQSEKFIVPSKNTKPLNPDFKSTVNDNFKDLVRRSIIQIKENKFQKVVPSKVKIIELPVDFDVVENFNILSTAYPRAFVFFVSIPSIGTWMGATPETFIEIENRKLFRTVSLAGTLKYNPEISTSQIAWTQKDIEEQALVSRYIINCFKKIRLREFTEYGPKTVIAGNVIHLKTVFEVDIEETGFYNLGTVMLDLLHPTSAVCGMPKEDASEFLKLNEQHKRKYYSGFLGPVNNNKDTHLFVNLRCMELYENQAVLYAGAGITEDSDPEKEWMETELKCNTLLNVIKTI